MRRVAGRFGTGYGRGLGMLAAVVFGVSLAVYSSTLGAQASPWLDWRTLTSPHFHIHFPAELEAQARRALALAEDVHERLAPRIGWEPRSRTDIVLTDQIGLPNGFAAPVPYNHIYLYATPPDGISTLAEYDDWFERLILHEYTHILHLDKATRLPAGARRVLGRNAFLFPNLFQPAWMLEGLAIHEETDRARGVGRGQSALFDMQMRMEVAAGIKPFDQVSMSGVTAWPSGNIPYLYGAYFFQFVAEEHGPQKVRALVDDYSGNIIPFLFNRNLRRALGKDGADLWAEFEEYLETRFGPQLAAVRGDGVIAGERLTGHGFSTGSASATVDQAVYYVRHRPDGHPALMRWRPATGPERIAHLHAPARIDAHAEHGVLVAQPEICRNRNLFYDVYHVNPDTGRTRRLTRCQRYRDAIWLPDGSGIMASRIEGGEARLDQLASDGTFRETVWRGSDGEVPGRMAMAPDGRRLAAALWRPGRGWALELLELDTGEWRALTADAVIEGDPAFTPDGASLIYSSAHGGVYNLRRLDIASGEAVTLTNVEGGAFSPTLAGEGGPLYYIGYTADGHDLFRLTSPWAEHPMPEPHRDRLPAPRDVGIAGGEPRPYRPWRTLLPRAWTPVAAVTEATAEVGLQVASFDVLRNHAYTLTAGQEVTEGLIWGGVGYSFAERFHLLAFRSFDYDADGGELERARSNDLLQARLALPWIRRDWRAAAHMGGGINRERDQFTAADVASLPRETSGVAGLALTFDNADRYPRAISPNRGRAIRLIGESNEVFGSDYTGEVYTLDWREYLPLGGQHVLVLRGVQGWGTDAPRPFRLGRAAAADLVGPGPLFDRRRYALRGYEETFQGRRMRLLSGEWRFPLKRLERSFTRFPLGLHQLSGRLIGESGAAWDEGRIPEAMRSSAGLELVADLNAFYRFNFRTRVGLAEGLDEGGRTEAYFLLEADL